MRGSCWLPNFGPFQRLYLGLLLEGNKLTFKVLSTRILSIFGFVHEFWKMPTANMTYTRLQNYTNLMVGKHGIQTFEVMIVILLLFDIFVPTNAHPLFGQLVCPNILNC